MKKDIHPTYHQNAKITCACGAVFDVGSTMSSINVEICSQCHPYYTGKEKLLDTAGRVDKFKARMAVAQQHKKDMEQKKLKNKARKEDKKDSDNK